MKNLIWKIAMKNVKAAENEESEKALDFSS